jgi:hypothetical protein
MTTETTEVFPSDPSVGATADIPLAWHQINWRQAERNVRRLQARIAQATQAGKWGKVKALQRLLTHSFKGKRWLLHLWKEQRGLCPICHQKITKITGWHSHHVLWRSKGGSDRVENRVLLSVPRRCLREVRVPFHRQAFEAAKHQIWHIGERLMRLQAQLRQTLAKYF